MTARTVEAWTLRLSDEQRLRLSVALLRGDTIAVERLDDDTVRISVRAAADAAEVGEA
mgnify:CR=1 FL=1|jgi:hypothetical protein